MCSGSLLIIIPPVSGGAGRSFFAELLKFYYELQGIKFHFIEFETMDWKYCFKTLSDLVAARCVIVVEADKSIIQ